MCGLVGYVITDQKVSQIEASRYQKYFGKALYIDTLRGSDSTGVARIDTDWVADTYKKAMPGYDYLEHGLAQQFMNEGSQYITALLGHNRAATAGAVNAVNAHPFTHGSITLMHNGTLDTCAGVGNKFDVDSENICYALSKLDDEKEIVALLEELDGAFALVWYDQDKRTVNFARNDKRPLSFQETGHGWLYASEAWMLQGATSEQFSQELQKKGGIKSLPVGDWTSINLDSGVIKTVPFKPDEGYNKWSWGSYDSASSSSPSSKADLNGLKKGDGVLVEYTSHGISTVNNKTMVTFYGKVVSQYVDAEIPSTSVTMAGYGREDIDIVLKGTDGGKRVFAATYGGSYDSSSKNHKQQVWVTDSEPLYTTEELKDFAIVEGDDTIYENYLIAPTEVTSDDIPFDEGRDYFDHKGNKITKEEMARHAETPCAWCNSWMDIDKDEIIWNGDYLMHTDCSGHFDDSYKEQ